MYHYYYYCDYYEWDMVLRTAARSLQGRSTSLHDMHDVVVRQSWFNVAARKVTSNNTCGALLCCKIYLVTQSQEHLLRNSR